MLKQIRVVGVLVAIEFNLPGSSLEEIKKILKGYSSSPDQTSLDNLSRLVGLHKSNISRNSKFLTDIGLISGGVKKGATDLGKKLGRALDHNQEADARSYWREAVQTNEKVSGLVTTVRIKNGMTEKDFSSHILYVSGQKNTSGNRTGARCVVDVLLSANLLKEEDGKLMVSAAAMQEPPTDFKVDGLEPPKTDSPKTEHRNGTTTTSLIPSPVTVPMSTALTPQIAINIQLHLPETENAEVYEKLFKALREQLLDPRD